MSCKHGNWAPCDECDEEDAAWQSAYNAGVKQTEAETSLLREQLIVAVGGLNKIANPAVVGCINDAAVFRKFAQQALAQIKDLDK